MAGGSSDVLSRRVVKEMERLQKDPVAGISVSPFADNFRHLNVSLEGPADTPYAGGIFRLEMFLPTEYPMVPPKVRFLTKIYHPNIDKLGRICLDILKDKWSPALQVRSVLLSLQALMSAPNPTDPLNEEAATKWREDEAAAHRIAREMTEKFATV